MSGPQPAHSPRFLVASWRRTGPHLGRMPTFSPRAGREFLVGGGRAKPGRHPPKTVGQEKINSKLSSHPNKLPTEQKAPPAPWSRTRSRPVPGLCRGGSQTRPYLLAADGSAPRQDADVLAPCQGRVLRVWAAGEARRPHTQNYSLLRGRGWEMAPTAHAAQSIGPLNRKRPFGARGGHPAGVFPSQSNTTPAADGSAPWRGIDVFAPCIERVLCARWAGEARPPRTQNNSLRERNQQAPISKTDPFPLNEIQLIDGQNSVLPWRRRGPRLGGVPMFSPRAGREFLVGGGRAKPGRHPPKTVCLREGKKGKTYPFPSLLSCHVLSNVQFYIKFCCS